jgi:spore germination cell wall hydrolase CwlJ-like protein
MTTTAPTPQDVQNLAWTMLGEAANQGTAEMQAVASVIRKYVQRR